MEAEGMEAGAHLRARACRRGLTTIAATTAETEDIMHATALGDAAAGDHTFRCLSWTQFHGVESKSDIEEDCNF